MSVPTQSSTHIASEVPLAPLTTLRLGGPAARLCEPASAEELVEVVRAADAAREPVLVLGGGSNVVIADAGFPGLVVRVRHRGVTVRRDGPRVHLRVGAGEPLDALAARAADEGWAGLEALSGIPGLAGATPLQNVGAYGAEISDVLRRVRVLDRDRAAVVDLGASECGFAYRDSIFRGSARWVVLELDLELAAHAASAPIRYAELASALGVPVGGGAPVRAVRDTVLRLRRAKGMVVDEADPESASAGSFFTNPVLDEPAWADLEARARAAGAVGPDEALPSFRAAGGRRKIAAAWLIERAGFAKGYGHGGVAISRKHALALVNRGGATTAELLALAREIRDGVAARFGVTLVPEPVLVGVSL